MRRPPKEDPSLPIRLWRIDEAVRAYQAYGEDVRRLTDSILDSLFGLSLPKIAEQVQSMRDETERQVLELASEPDPEELYESDQGEVVD